MALQVLGVQPRRYYEKKLARSYTSKTLMILTIMVLLVIILEQIFYNWVR